MKKALGLLLTLAIATAACGGGSGTDPASAKTCDDLAEISVNLIQELLDSTAGMSMDELNSLEEPPAAFAALEEKGVELEERAAEIGCSEEDAQQLTCDRASDLSASGEAAEFLLELFLSGC